MDTRYRLLASLSSLLLLVSAPTSSRAAKKTEPQALAIDRQAAQLYMQGRWQEAEPLYKEALLKSSGLPAEDQARLWEEYAILLQATGRGKLAGEPLSRSTKLAQGMSTRPCPSVFSAVMPQGSNCDELRRGFSRLPILPLPEGGWSIPAEDALRARLRERFGVTVATGLFPIGYIERAPENGKRYLLVFAMALGPQGRLGPFLKARWDGGSGFADPAYLWFLDRVGYYRLAPKAAAAEGSWMSLDGGLLAYGGDGNPLSCSACQEGLYMCPKTAFACFSDFNGNGREEIHLSLPDPNFPGLCVAEPDASGTLRAVLEIEQGGMGRWLRGKDGWRLEVAGGAGVKCHSSGECLDGKTYRFKTAP